MSASPVPRIALTFDDLLDEFLHNPTVFFGLILTVLAAITLPFAVVLVFRVWHYIFQKKPISGAMAERRNNEQSEHEDTKNLRGSFNTGVIKTLYHVPLTGEENLTATSKKVSFANDEHRNKAEQADFSELETAASNSANSDVSDDEKFAKNAETKKATKPNSFNESDEKTAQALKKLSEVGLHGKLATAQLRVKTTKIEQSMSDEERQKENEIRNAQLSAIFQMMQNHEDKYGFKDESDLVEQLKLYSV